MGYESSSSPRARFGLGEHFQTKVGRFLMRLRRHGGPPFNYFIRKNESSGWSGVHIFCQSHINIGNPRLVGKEIQHIQLDVPYLENWLRFKHLELPLGISYMAE